MARSGGARPARARGAARPARRRRLQGDAVVPFRALPAWAWLLAIVAGSTAFRLSLGRSLPGPFIFVDELVYAELARSFADAGRFLVRDVPTSGYGVVYPVLISPAYRLFSSLPQAYAAAKAINSLLMSLAAVPAYLLARRMLGQGLSLLAALLAVAVPSMVYTGTVMTENVFYPLFLLVALVLALVLERPTVWRQVALLGLVVVGYLTRAQSLAFVPALLLAPPLLLLLQGGRGATGSAARRLRPFAPLYGLTAAGAALVVAGQLARGRSPSDLLGAYEVVSSQSYSVRRIADFTLWHAADLALYAGVLPLAATILLVAGARRENRHVQAFLAATIPLAAAFTVEVAAFSTRFASDRIHERNLFELVPLLAIGLLVWARGLDEGAPRRWPLAIAAAAAASLLPLTIPFTRFVGDPVRADTLALVPVWTINAHFLAGSADLTVGLVCVGLGALLLVVPRGAGLALPLVVLAWFVLLLQPVFGGPHGFRASSRGAVFQGIRGVERDWIDAALPRGARVAALWTGATDRFTINQNEFFNRSVEQVYYTGQPTPGGLHEERMVFDRDGLARVRGRLVRPGYLLADGTIVPDGVPVARDAPLGVTLWRVRGALLTTHSTVTGLYPGDTWSGAHVGWSARPCRRGGVLRVSLRGDPNLFERPQTVIARSDAATATVRVPLTGTVDLRVRTRPRGRVCSVRFTVAPTRVPRLVTGGANPDPRQLGAHFLLFDFRPDRR